MISIRVVLALAALLAVSCGRDDLSRLIREAAACGAGDACVLAGQSSCSCASPVNASRSREVNDAAGRVSCGGMTVACRALVNPRCDVDAGLCTADPL